MFDATKGQQAVTDQIEARSDEFAARFTSLSPREQLAFLQKANELLDDPNQVLAFQTGTYAQNSTGQPAAQLGTGSPSSNSGNAQEGLQAILSDDNVDSGIKLALKRLLTPNDPDHIPVGRDGTPSELVAAKRERDQARTERDAARVELLHERDPNRDGSLAKQLAAVTAERDAARAAAGGYNQTAALAALAAVDQAIEDQVGKMGGRVEGRSELKQKLSNLLAAVRLSRP